MSTFLCILLISYNTYLSSPHPQLFLIIFASINPIEILLKADCLPCLILFPNSFTKPHFTFLPNSTFSTSSLSFSSPALPYPTSSDLIFCPPDHSITCNSDLSSVLPVGFSGPRLRQIMSHQTQVSLVEGRCSSTTL